MIQQLNLEPPIETRSLGYTDSIIDALVAGAEGLAADAGRTAALETACGFVARCFASATVQVAEPWQRVLGAAWRANAGRRLIRHGEYVALLRTVPVELEPAFEYDILPSARYRLTFSRPTSTVTTEAGKEAVVHVLYGAAEVEPWRGRGPLQFASSAARLQGAVEAQLADEVGNAPFGSILSLVAETGKEEAETTRNRVTAQLKTLRGRLFVQPSRLTLPTGKQPDLRAQTKNWLQSRIGADPPEQLVNLARQNFENCLAACGLNASLFVPGAAGPAIREMWRLAVRTTIEPLGALLAEELARVLETTVAFDFDRVGSSDSQSKASAVKMLVAAGVQVDEALRRVW